MSAADIIQDIAGIATAFGVPTAVVAGLIAVRSLKTQADAQRLEAILTTNRQWQDVAKANQSPANLSARTINAIIRAYEEMKCDWLGSAVKTGDSPVDLTSPVPFAAAAFLPFGESIWEQAPNDESTYLTRTYARTLALGYVRTVLSTPALSSWLKSSERVEISDDLRRLDQAMERWVGRMNEIAELYENNLVDRPLFVRKRSVSLIQQLFAAEPYILWRNSTTPGRWGLRILGIGAEARFYHWRSYLQHAAIRLRVDPPGYGPCPGYAGFSESLGWIIGPGATTAGSSDRRLSERTLHKGLGVGFNPVSKQLQNDVIASLPTNKESGLRPGPFEWLEVCTEPRRLARALKDFEEARNVSSHRAPYLGKR